MIDIDRIRPDPNQPRKTFDAVALAELQASIAKVGILQPITVRYLPEGVYQVLTGERRFQAAKALGLKSIPCWERTPHNEHILVHQIVENWQRRDLEPLEIRDALIALRESTGMNQRQLAELTGKPEEEISRMFRIEQLHPEVEERVRKDSGNTFSKRHLVAIASLKSEKQIALAQRVFERKLTAEATEALVRQERSPQESAKRRGAPPALRFRFTTSHGVVTISVRKKQPTTDDVLLILDEARKQVLDARSPSRQSI